MANLLKGMGLMGAGAYGYQQARESDVLQHINRVANFFPAGSVNRGGADVSSSGGGAYGPEIRSLQGEVDRLHGLLTDMVRGNHGRATVIHTGRSGGSGWTLYAYPVAGMGLLYAYCRWRGINMWDLFFVSQSSMVQFKTSVTEGFSRLWDEVRKQKDELMVKLGSVGRKQEQLMESHEAMDERLRQVGDSVDDVKANTHNINCRVAVLDGKLGEVRDGVVNVQQGILLLVQTVAEVTNRIGMHNTRSSQALKGFLSNAAPQGGAAAALPSTTQPLALPGGAVGLSALLPDGEDGGSAATVAAVYPGDAVAAKAGGGGGSTGGGPPSFPKSQSASANPQASLPGMFWGRGRS